MSENAAGVSFSRDPISQLVGVEVWTSVNFFCLSRKRWRNHSNGVGDNVLNFPILNLRQILKCNDDYKKVTFQNKI